MGFIFHVDIPSILCVSADVDERSIGDQDALKAKWEERLSSGNVRLFPDDSITPHKIEIKPTKKRQTSSTTSPG